jgi:hypothetical protein
LAAHGFHAGWQKLTAVAHPKIWQTLFLFITISLLIFELWNGPFPDNPLEIHPFYKQLAQEDESFALIELPMGRRASKRYLLNQTVHQKPIVEGLSARTPTEAYRYIAANPLLLNWQQKTMLNCEVMGSELDVAAAQLIQDNFRYVIVHNAPDSDLYIAYFHTAPVFQDEQLTVFAVEDLAERPFCP